MYDRNKNTGTGNRNQRSSEQRVKIKESSDRQEKPYDITSQREGFLPCQVHKSTRAQLHDKYSHDKYPHMLQNKIQELRNELGVRRMKERTDRIDE